MSYNPNIPLPYVSYQDCQPELLENFKVLNDFLNVNHITAPFTSPAAGDEGKHLLLQIPRISDAVNGIPSTTATDISIYASVGLQSRTQLFFRRQSNGVTSPISESTNSTPDSVFNSYRLPNGLLLTTFIIPIPQNGADGNTFSFDLNQAIAPALLPPITQQYFFIGIPMQNGTQDANIFFSPKQYAASGVFTFATYRRDSYNTRGASAPFNLFFLAVVAT